MNLATHTVNSPASIALPTQGQTPAEILFVLGVIGYGQTFPAGFSIAFGSFDRLVGLAEAHGFLERRQLIAALRRGKATRGAMRKAERVIALLAPAEIENELCRLTAWLQFMSTGHLPRGWTFKS